MTYFTRAETCSTASNPATFHPVARHYRPAGSFARVIQHIADGAGATMVMAREALEAHRQHRLNRAAVERMLGLEDHMLHDIGLTRADVEWANRLPLSVNAATELETRAIINRKEWKR
ncbi:DUF1127 domain-containing protein [Salaquimonas pukyongi]|uniref:DUF1127 domain-containing protein n=1 Tax=Salaquimonas pukyongi TaxID=2712698 RepID=UPI00096BC5B1|nr:DUF1127 domain-containing protein [Salaquimonas pukyongi]